MIHEISLAECLEQASPPEQVLRLGACDDTVFVKICRVEQDHERETFHQVAEISVSLPALIEALSLLAVDHEREDLRPVDSDGRTRETKFAGRRLTVAGVAPWSAVSALTTHYRHTPEPKNDEGSAREDPPLSATCTGPDCGEQFADSETGEYLFAARERMERLLYADGWTAGPVLCPACQEEAGGRG